MKTYVYVDRYGVKLVRGMRVKVQHCIGRFGKTEVLVGKLVRINTLGNVDVELDVPVRRRNGLPAGLWLYPGFKVDEMLGQADAYRDKVVLRGYCDYEDAEHGHVKYIEVMRQLEEDKLAA